MKGSVKLMYDSIKMPEDCEKAIWEAAGTAPVRKKRSLLRPVLSAAAVLALVLFLTPPVRAAVTGVVRHIFGQAVVVLDTSTGEVQSILSWPTQTDAAPCAGERYVETAEGRVLFHSPESTEDITDQISPEKPYIQRYVDGDGLEHLLIVGGTPDSLGFSEFLREHKDGLAPWEGWEGGSSENYLDISTEKAYPWLKAAWDELQLPWPMPGA